MGCLMTTMSASTTTTSGRALRWGQRIGIVTLWLVAFVMWRNYRQSNDLSTLEAGQRFIDTVGTAWWGALAFIGVYLARPLALFPASVLTVVGGILFGPWLGIAIVVIAANASAMVAFGVGRLLGRPPGAIEPVPSSEASPSSPSTFVARWSHTLRTNSFETVFVMRLIFLPYDLVNYACGALRIRWTSFLLATALGSLPGTIYFVLLGASLERLDEGIGGIDPIAIFASVAIFVASIAISRRLKRRGPVRPTDLETP